MTRSVFIRRTLAAGALMLMLVMLPPVALGQPGVLLQACRRISVHPGAGGAFGDRLTVSECGGRFTTQDRYIVLLVTLQRVDVPVEVGIQLLDPDASALWTTRADVRPEGGSVYENYWLYAVLPVAADLQMLVQENLRLALAALRFPGRPARERLGEWTLRVAVNRGRPHELKFTLEAAPGAPPVSPTPTPAPSPSPSP